MRTRSYTALALICGAQFALQLDFSIVNVALPAIQRELGLAAAQLQWVVTGYALTFGSLLLAGGRIADLVGRRRLLELGLIAFAVASLGAGLAPSSLPLIVARVIQGAAGAMVSPAALSLLTTTFDEGPARTRALGIWQAATAAGATTGIVAGGVLTQALGWRAIFLVNPPLIAIILPLVHRILPEAPASGGTRLDLSGALLATGTIAAVIFGLSNGQQHGFAAPLTLGVLGAALALGAAFILTERSVRAPMLPLGIFADATRRTAVIVMTSMGAVVAAYVYFVSLYLQDVEHYSAILTGIALLPATVTVVITSTVITGRLLKRLDVTVMLLLGVGSIAIGQLWLSRISVAGGYPAEVLPGLLFTAFGMGLTFPTASIAITNGLAAGDQGIAGAVFVTAQQAGAAIGLAALAAVAASRSQLPGKSLTAGYRFAFVIAAGLAVVAGLVVVGQLWHRARRPEPARSSS